MYNCVICSEPVLQARWELGYNYCMKPDCAFELRERASAFVWVLVPKQGHTVVPKTDPFLYNGGMSSGR